MTYEASIDIETGMQEIKEGMLEVLRASAAPADGGGHSERAHAENGASGASCWMTCAGSVYMKRTSPRRPSSPAAAEGTRAHELLEKQLMGQMVTAEDCAPYDAEDMLAGVQEAVDWVHEKLAECPGATLFLEKPFKITEAVWGTNDIGIYDPNTETLHIFDFKYGRKLVHAQGNKQMRIYGLGGILELAVEGKLVEKVTLTIGQPRAPDSNGDTIRTEEVDILDLYQFALDVDRAVQKTKVAAQVLESLAYDSAENQESFWSSGEWKNWFAPSDDTCLWCVPANCQAAHEQARESLPAIPDSVYEIGEWAPPPVAGIDTARLIAIKQAEATIKKFLKAVSVELMVRGLHGDDLGPLKIVMSQARRKFMGDTETVLDGLDKIVQNALPRETYVVPKLKGIGVIEKAILGLPDDILAPYGKTKKERTKMLKAAMADLMEKKSGGSYVIVEGTDKRDAVEVDPLKEIDFSMIADLIEEMEEGEV